MKHRLLLIALSILISVAALVWAIKGIEWKQLTNVLSGVSAWVPIAAALVYLLSFAPRAYRSIWMLEHAVVQPFSPAHAGQAQVMGYAANNLLPLRLGEFVRVFALYKLVGLSRITGLASLLAERILDGLIVVIILGFTVIWFSRNGSHFGKTEVNSLMYAGGALFFFAVTFLLLLASFANQITNWSVRLLPARFHGIIQNILNALAFFRDRKKALGVIILSVLVWMIEGSVFVLVISSIGIKEPIMVGYFMLAVVNLGILLPSAPGYVGVFQACGILAFEILELPRELGLAASLLIHFCQFLPITVIGIFLASFHGWSLNGMAKTTSHNIP